MQLSTLLLVQLGALVLGTPVDHTSLTTRQVDTTTTNTTTANIPFPFDDTEDNINTLGAALDFLANIPTDNNNSTPTTQEGLHAWAHAHKGDYFTTTNSTSDDNDGSGFTPKHHHHDHSHSVAALEARFDFLKIAACAAEIAKVILENAIPLGELLKVKRLIEALGGAYRVAKLLVKAKSLAELYAISNNMQELVEILLGVAGVVGACGLHF